MTVPEPDPGPRAGLVVGMVPGVTVTKWTRIWAERFPSTPLEALAVEQPDQRVALDEGRVDLCFVRQPFEREGAHLIPLYEEVPVVVVPKDHPAAVVEAVSLADLEGEDRVDPGETARDHDLAFDLVAAGAGVLFVPHSIARAHTRKDLRYVPVQDADPTPVGLAWLVATGEGPRAELVEEFIGVVRGRTVNSTRSPSGARTPAKAAPERERAGRRPKPQSRRGRRR